MKLDCLLITFHVVNLIMIVSVMALFAAGISTYWSQPMIYQNLPWAKVNIPSIQTTAYYGLLGYYIDMPTAPFVFQMYQTGSTESSVSTSSFTLLILCFALLIALFVLNIIRFFKDKHSYKWVTFILSLGTLGASSCAWVPWYLLVYKNYISSVDANVMAFGYAFTTQMTLGQELIMGGIGATLLITLYQFFCPIFTHEEKIKVLSLSKSNPSVNKSANDAPGDTQNPLQNA